MLTSLQYMQPIHRDLILKNTDIHSLREQIIDSNGWLPGLQRPAIPAERSSVRALSRGYAVVARHMGHAEHHLNPKHTKAKQR